MRPLVPWLRPWPYLLLGLLVGSLFLAEFGLIASAFVRAALLVLAVVGLVGVVLGVRSLALWPLFVAGAMVTPLVATSHVIGLPPCTQVARGVACFAGSRDITGELAAEIVTFVIALGAIVLLIVRVARRL